MPTYVATYLRRTIGNTRDIDPQISRDRDEQPIPVVHPDRAVSFDAVADDERGMACVTPRYLPEIGLLRQAAFYRRLLRRSRTPREYSRRECPLGRARRSLPILALATGSTSVAVTLVAPTPAKYWESDPAFIGWTSSPQSMSGARDVCRNARRVVSRDVPHKSYQGIRSVLRDAERASLTAGSDAARSSSRWRIFSAPQAWSSSVLKSRVLRTSCLLSPAM